ncbi:MAG TPA: hypothetical protein VFU05_05355 [Cyclobacteriaceae bacterium]|nr:hypothetical protein [Cyclobacteriaceae bacterium]
MKAEKVTNIIQVFKTNVNDPSQADMLCDLIQTDTIVQRANFDLEDCDKIFRVESTANIDEKIIAILHLHGFTCEELPD